MAVAYMKPALFNTDMVVGLMMGRKGNTRRLIKPQPEDGDELNYIFASNRNADIGKWLSMKTRRLWKPPYQAGDVLYVREAFAMLGGRPVFRADFPGGTVLHEGKPVKWSPSLHMPANIARIFLKATKVRVERLQDISEEDIRKEGVYKIVSGIDAGRYAYQDQPAIGRCWSSARGAFRQLWDSTVKLRDREAFGWNANPWVWVIEFEEISLEEARELLRNK